jgi:hypothetical protein
MEYLREATGAEQVTRAALLKAIHGAHVGNNSGDNESIPQGVALGISRSAHLAIGASSRLAAGTVQPWGHPGGAGGGITVNIHTLQGGQEVARHVHQMLQQYKRTGGGVPLGLG